jgi:HEAT repeat protein
MQLIDQAVAGDSAAVRTILQYLNASNPDLRQMIQTALHANRQPALWERLLHCIGHECWPALPGAPALAPSGSPASALAPTRAAQSMIEVFVIEKSHDPEAEGQVKLQVLVTSLADPDLLVRWTAGYLLGLRGDLRAAPLLEEIIQRACHPTGLLSEEQCLRWQLRAIHALATLNDPLCGPPLIQALASRQRTVHHAAGQALNELGQNAAPALIEALHHPDPHVRWHVARALGQIGDLRAVATLAEGLVDDNQEVRWTAARVLANLDVPAIPAILNLLVTRPINEPLRQAAYHALNGMYGLRQPEIHAYLLPLLDELRRQSALAIVSPEIALVAQRLLSDWKNVYPALTGLPRREDRQVEFPGRS